MPKYITNLLLTNIISFRLCKGEISGEQISWDPFFLGVKIPRCVNSGDEISGEEFSKMRFQWMNIPDTRLRMSEDKCGWLLTCVCFWQVPSLRMHGYVFQIFKI